MKRTQPSKRKGIDPVEKRPAWRRVWSSAWIKVSVSGGPIHDPHEPVFQLLIRPGACDDESWTVYRLGARPHNDGKIEFSDPPPYCSRNSLREGSGNSQFFSSFALGSSMILSITSASIADLA